MMIRQQYTRIRTAATMLAVFGLCFVAGTSMAHAKTVLTNIPMVWKPTDLVPIPLAPAGTGNTIQLQTLVDTRENPSAIGENREDADEGKILPVTTRDDVAQWSTERLAKLLTKAGYTLVNDGGDIVLSGEIRYFFVTETSTYQGQASLALTLTDRSGRKLWSGSGTNMTSRFGRSYKAENYYEVLSDAFLGAVRSAVDQDSFRNAVRQPPAAP